MTKSNKESTVSQETFADIIAEVGGIRIPQYTTRPSPETIAVLSPDANDDDSPYENKMTYVTNGISSKRIKGISKQRPERTVDLHGMTVESAWAELDSFLSAAIADGLQHVEIVHGRGLHSPNGRAILRGKTRKWLVQSKFVLGYIQSNDKGATHALLRRKIS
ncbi:MAG: Smr/MutS family protein [Gammaproteobacteria bacterium WSBS_2016_MAG_OTU1]